MENTIGLPVRAPGSYNSQMTFLRTSRRTGLLGLGLIGDDSWRQARICRMEAVMRPCLEAAL